MKTLTEQVSSGGESCKRGDGITDRTSIIREIHQLQWKKKQHGNAMDKIL